MCAKVCEFVQGCVSLGKGVSVLARNCKFGCECVWARV